MRRFTARAAVSAAAALLLAGTPAANAAESQAPDVRYASSVTDDLGTLAVSVRSDSPVTAVRAHIVSQATGEEVAVVENDAFALSSGTPDDGIWHTKQPLDLAALGTYDVRVEATDADGDVTTDNSAGRLSYYMQAVLEDVRTDRAEVDVDNRAVRVEGELKGRWPATRELRPLADHPVDLDVDYWTEATVRTDAQGHFAGTVDVNAAVPVQAVYRYSGDHPGVLYGESQMIDIGVRQVATRWTVETPQDPMTVDFGQETTLAATLERETAQGWIPFASQSGGVIFEEASGGWDSVGQFTTGEDGRVTFSFSPYETGSFRLESHTEDPFIASASANSATITVLRASVFTAFSATRTQDGVRADGAMEFPGDWTPATVLVRIQHSDDGERWTDLSTVEAQLANDGFVFSADLPGTRSKGYFRAHFDSTAAFRAATSDAVKASR
ncbi:hypothetical protein [Streptomyces chilikensis]|uniref:hypothetical protein n=1 Tax=Streptomyces chilikensis TaxID=1194079 RepID=UPI001409F8EF|nr:hypothetical protein [Streptomyces chilikensis]